MEATSARTSATAIGIRKSCSSWRNKRVTEISAMPGGWARLERSTNTVPPPPGGNPRTECRHGDWRRGHEPALAGDRRRPVGGELAGGGRSAVGLIRGDGPHGEDTGNSPDAWARAAWNNWIGQGAGPQPASVGFFWPALRRRFPNGQATVNTFFVKTNCLSFLFLRSVGMGRRA